MKVRHKRLRQFAETGVAKGIDAAMARRLDEVLTALRGASGPSQLDNPGWRLHPLKGDLAGHWSVSVTRHWRVTFRFEGGEAVDVDLVDYHTGGPR
ncbi:MAG: type II toxin-antitoxin system RelE/ParE family toxin [Gammaproteobacteria bacterium]|nr:type II toxin-antitoxin system RelE/ParE family toxin [Gammaproteobacteria bacterium]MDE0272921.1 type II toxin-antitoxin system RelE/ParE family toxin [Gammaproteobacteria bacterium]